MLRNQRSCGAHRQFLQEMRPSSPNDLGEEEIRVIADVHAPPRSEMGRHKASSRASRAGSGVALYEGGGMISDPKYRRARSSSRASQAAARAGVFEGGGISSDFETEAPVPRGTGHSSWQGVSEMDSGNTPKRARLDKETETLDTFEFLHQKVIHQEEEIAQLRAHEVAMPSISQETLLRMYS